MAESQGLLLRTSRYYYVVNPELALEKQTDIAVSWLITTLICDQIFRTS